MFLLLEMICYSGPLYFHMHLFQISLLEIWLGFHWISVMENSLEFYFCYPVIFVVWREVYFITFYVSFIFKINIQHRWLLLVYSSMNFNTCIRFMWVLPQSRYKILLPQKTRSCYSFPHSPPLNSWQPLTCSVIIALSFLRTSR